MIAWRETPTTDPLNDTKVNHIRANAVSSSIPNTLSNVVLSAITGNEDPKNPTIAASTKNANAIVVWEDARNFSSTDIDLYGSLFNTTPAKALILKSPNGGEIWQEGTVQQITWESAGIGSSNVKIEYSTDQGASFTLISNQTNTDGTNAYNWTVPNTPSTQCLVQITTNGLSDQSDELFTIKEPPQISIITPNGGEEWLGGSQQQIKWETIGVGNFDVSIEYSTDNGSSFQFIDFYTNKDGVNTYNWEVPSNPSNQCLVKVSVLGVSDISDSLFTIVEPKITVISPNGGEIWMDGEQPEIKWTSTGFSGNVRIDLLYHGINDSGYFNIALNELNDGSFNWNLDISQLPIQSNPQGFNCLIRVSDATKNPPGIGPDDGKIFDWSDSYFTFKDNLPRITVISPNGGETWFYNGQNEIKWSSTNFNGPVRIDFQSIYFEFGIFSPGTWKERKEIIGTNIPNTGSYLCNISSPGPYDQQKCKIRVADAAKNDLNGPEDGKIFDWSDTTFVVTYGYPTPKGNSIKVDLGSETNISFHQIDTAGITFKYVLPSGSPPPSGSQIYPFEIPFHYFIETTASFSGNINVCFSYNDSILTPKEESNLQLNVFDTTLAKWVNITTTLDLDSNMICGEVNHLSEFAIMMPTSDRK